MATGTQSSVPADLERRTGRYLLAIYWLSTEGEERISTGDLRAELGVSAASVTEMIAKLDDRGLVDHEKYRGATLTDRGADLARHLAWRVCVVTSFFEGELGADLAAGDSYAISYALPADGVASLHDRVDHPCIDQCPETRQDYEGCLL